MQALTRHNSRAQNKRTRRKPYGTAPVRGKPAGMHGVGGREQQQQDPLEEVHSFLEDLEIEMDARCKTLELQSAHLADILKSSFAVELTKLPQKIKKMSVRQFSQEFQGSLVAVIEHDRQKIFEAMHAAEDGESDGEEVAAGGPQGSDASNNGRAYFTRSARKRPVNATVARERTRARVKRAAAATGTIARSKTAAARVPTSGSAPPSTPSPAVSSSISTSHSSYAGLPPQTPIVREPKRGEQLLSANGSPLGSFASVRATVGPKPGRKSLSTPDCKHCHCAPGRRRCSLRPF